MIVKGFPDGETGGRAEVGNRGFEMASSCHSRRFIYLGMELEKVYCSRNPGS